MVLVRLVPVALVAQVVHVLLALQVPVAQVVRASAHHVQVLVAAPVALVLQVAVASAALVRVPVVAVAVAARPVHSVRAAHAVRPRLASRSVRNAKSSNREWLRASVAQLCLVATATPSFVCVADPASRISQTRLMPMPVS